MSESTPSDMRTGEQSASFITRACDMCRKKKIRCEVISDTCFQCISFKTQCHFTPITVRRKPRRPAGEKHVEKLEKRLQWVEYQLKLATENQQTEASLKSSNEFVEPDKLISYQSQAMKTFSTHDNLVYSPLKSAFDVRGVTSQAPEFRPAFLNTSLMHESDTQLAMSPWTLLPASCIFVRKVFKALPPKDEALKLIKKSFESFNSAFPLFDQASFINTFEYGGKTMDDPDWWACLNAVLALTHRFGGSATQDKREDQDAWGYFLNALAVSNQFTTMRCTLSSVQALIGMALVILGTSNRNAGFLLISTAIKLAQSLGLHREYHEGNLSTAEVELRKRVFWIAYCLDKDISMQTGHPPTQDDDDMDVELPSEYKSTPNSSDRWHSTGFFNYKIRLAMIQGQIYKRLCSVKATRGSTTERVMAAKELEAMLQRWRASVPIRIQHICPTSNVPQTPSDRFLLPTILQLSYFNCLATIYNSIPNLSWYNHIQEYEEAADTNTVPAPIIYAAEARKAIKALDFTPRRHDACIRAVLHIFVSASSTLLTHTLSNPANPFARADLKLVEPLLKVLCILATNPSSGDEVSEMYRSSAKLFERATKAVDVSNLTSMDWVQHSWQAQSAKSGDRESVEDFLLRMEKIRSEYDDDVALSLTSQAGVGEGAFGS